MVKRYKGYVARNLLDRHTYHSALPTTMEQRLELTKLEASQLASKMKNKSIPMHYEHKHKMVKVGKVLDAWVGTNSDGTQDLVAEFESDDSISGSAIESLLDSFALNCLSLTHIPAHLEPLELSVVERGARPGTVIMERPNNPEWISQVPVCASAEATIELLKSPIYKTMYVDDSVISASINNVTSSFSGLNMSSMNLLRNPEAVSHDLSMASGPELSKIEREFFPADGSNPLSDPGARAARQKKAEQAQQFNRLSEDYAKLKAQVDAMSQAKNPQQQQQPQSQDVPMTNSPPPPAQQYQQQQQPTNSSFAPPPQQQQQQQSQYDLDLKQQYDMMLKIKEENENYKRQAELKKKQEEEFRPLLNKLFSDLKPLDAQTQQEVKSAVERGDYGSLANTHEKLMAIKASAAEQEAMALKLKTMEAQMNAFKAQLETQAQTQDMVQDLQYNQSVLNNVIGTNTHPGAYSQPIQASGHLALNNPIPGAAAPMNSEPMNAEQYERLEATYQVFMKQNGGKVYNPQTANSANSWEPVPYAKGSVAESVMKGQHMTEKGIGDFNWCMGETWRAAAVLQPLNGAFIPS